MPCIQTRGLAYGQIHYNDLSIEGGKATFISGFSGSGKSSQSQGLIEQHGVVRVRADVERKRLFGLEIGRASCRERVSSPV